MTLPPPVSSYGNATGLVLSPVYHHIGLKHTVISLYSTNSIGNRIGVLKSYNLELVEYAIPSANPKWADCLPFCAKVFFDISDQKVNQ